jgi:hypothetical protein
MFCTRLQYSFVGSVFIALVFASMTPTLCAAEEEETTAVLTWGSESEPDTQCLLQARLPEEVSAILARNPFVPTLPATFHLEAHLSTRPSHFKVEMRMRDPDGTVLGVRTVESSSCEELVRALAIVVAMMVESPVLEASLVAPAIQASSPSQFGFVSGASVMGMAGAITPALLGGGLFVGFQERESGFELRLRIDMLGTPFTIADVSVVAIGFRPELSACFDAPIDQARVGGCAFVGVPWLSARGIDFDVTHSAELLGADVGASARATFPLGGPFMFRVELGFAVPLRTFPFEVEGPTGMRGVLWQAWPVAPLARVEAVIELPEILGSSTPSLHPSS